MKTVVRIAVLTVTLALLCMVSVGDVFMRAGRVPAGSGIRGLPSDARKGYDAPVLVNGGKGHLSVWTVACSPAQVAAGMQAAYSEAKPGSFMAGEDLAYCMVGDAGLVTRCLAIAANGRATVFALEQSEEQYKLSSDPRAQRGGLMDRACPEAVPAFSAANEDTGASLEIARSRSSPASVLEACRALLNSEGWTSPFPAMKPAPGEQGTLFFVRGGLLVMVSATPSDDGTIISIIRR